MILPLSEIGVHGVSGAGSACGTGGDSSTPGHVQIRVWELVGQASLHCEWVTEWGDGVTNGKQIFKLFLRISVWFQSRTLVSIPCTYSTVSGHKMSRDSHMTISTNQVKGRLGRV